MESTLLPEQLMSVVDNIISGICVFAIDEKRNLTPVYLNEGLYRMLGYKYSELDRMLKDVRRVIIPDDLQVFEQGIDDILKDDGAVEFEFRTVTGDGNLRWIQVRANLYGKEDGYRLIAGIILDSTEKKNIEEELALQAERNNILLESAKEHLIDYNVRTDVLNIKLQNKSYRQGEIVIKDFIAAHDFKAFHEDDRQFVRETFAAAVKAPLTDKIEFRTNFFEPGDDSYHWYRMTLTSVMGMEGYISRIVGRVSNIDEKKKKELELELRADRDALTGLYNKGAATKFITDSIEKCYENGTVAALIMLDLDHFKSVNDTFGHAVGDQVIAQAGHVLSDTFKGHDIVGRMGGDEFMVLMDDIKGSEDALNIAEKLNSLLTRHLKDSQGEVTVTASIGIVMLGDKMHDFRSMYEAADRALYATKQNGRNGRTIVVGDGMETYN